MRELNTTPTPWPAVWCGAEPRPSASLSRPARRPGPIRFSEVRGHRFFRGRLATPHADYRYHLRRRTRQCMELHAAAGGRVIVPASHRRPAGGLAGGERVSVRRAAGCRAGSTPRQQRQHGRRTAGDGASAGTAPRIGFVGGPPDSIVSVTGFRLQAGARGGGHPGAA